MNWFSPRMSAGPSLLGVRPQSAPSLLGGYPQNTENLMAQYLQNLFMRRYNPPAIAQQPGMVGSQMGQGGMQYMAPQLPNLPSPAAQSSWASGARGPQYNPDGTWNFNSGFGSPG